MEERNLECGYILNFRGEGGGMGREARREGGGWEEHNFWVLCIIMISHPIIMGLRCRCELCEDVCADALIIICHAMHVIEFFF